MTSNTAPPQLYSGGLNRHVYLPPFIGLLGDHCTVLGLGGGKRKVDYRRRVEAAELAEVGGEAALASGVYFYGADANEKFAERWSEHLAIAGGKGQPRTLKLPMGRTLHLDEAAGSACRVSFEELCSMDRGEAEFLTLADNFSAVLLHGVPAFSSLEEMDVVKRFVKLLDVLYDRRIRLVVAAASQPGELFDGIRKEVAGEDLGDLAWRTALYSSDGKGGMNPHAVGTLVEAIRATDRAESRLREMRTRRYWQGCEATAQAA
jgi:predicted ATPase